MLIAHSNARSAPPIPWREPHFAVALVAAAIFWWGWYGTQQPMAAASGPLIAPERLLMLVLVYPVLEELAFRGALQELLHRCAWGGRTLGGLSVANGLTTLLFCAAHAVHHAPPAAALVFFPSLVFGYFRDRYRAVWPAALLHVCYNLGFFWTASLA